MRISTSLSLALSAAVLVVLGGNGWLQLHAEEANLAAAAQQELTLVTTAIRSSAQTAIRDAQVPDVVALLQQLELRDPAVDVFVIGEQGTLLSSSDTQIDAGEVQGFLAGLGPVEGVQVGALDSGAFAAVAQLDLGSAGNGWLVVVRPMTTLRADLSEERRGILLSVGALILVLASLNLLVVRRQVHLPMARIVEGVRQVRAGDTSARIGLRGNDELGELAREFDAMTESLAQARLDLSNAAEARERLAAEMRRANELAIVGELAATLAHEIGSPLQVLHGRARDLALRDELAPDARRSAAIMVEQSERVHRIVERLLGVARRKAPALAEIDVSELVRPMLELIGSHARRLGVRIETELAPLPVLRGDPGQLQQVVLNLLQNALRAAGRGGCIRVGTMLDALVRPGVGERPCATIFVEDSGPGIDPELSERVFEPFFTAWADEHPRPGTGLGLAVVKSIVKDHGGQVVAERAALGGARFVVRLPLESDVPDDSKPTR